MELRKRGFNYSSTEIKVTEQSKFLNMAMQALLLLKAPCIEPSREIPNFAKVFCYDLVK